MFIDFFDRVKSFFARTSITHIEHTATGIPSPNTRPHQQFPSPKTFNTSYGVIAPHPYANSTYSPDAFSWAQSSPRWLLCTPTWPSPVRPDCDVPPAVGHLSFVQPSSTFCHSRSLWVCLASISQCSRHTPPNAHTHSRTLRARHKRRAAPEIVCICGHSCWLANTMC